MLSVRQWPADRRRIAASITGAIVASASLGTFGCTGRMTDLVCIRFAQAPQLCQKRGKVGSVKQRLLAELNAFEVASFDRCVERSATDTEQVKCLPDPVSCLRKTEKHVGQSDCRSRPCRSVLLALLHSSNRVRVISEGEPWPHCAIRAGSNEQPESALHYAVSPFRDRDAGVVPGSGVGSLVGCRSRSAPWIAPSRREAARSGSRSHCG